MSDKPKPPPVQFIPAAVYVARMREKEGKR
jgi:hypothetical protein